MLAQALLLLALAEAATVRGVVTDATGLPLPQVNVYVEGSQEMTTTDAQGHFELVLPRRADPVTVVAFRHGFKPQKVEIPAEGAPRELNLILDRGVLSESITVVAARPTEIRLLPIDIVQMAGSQADAFHALQSLPGVAKVDEGAGLFVQGGDTSEVLFLLDGAVISHPYKYETPTGGLFGFVEPFLFEGLSFSSAGFSARYGNALSAVLELRGLRRPSTRQYYATLGLGGTSGQFAFPLGKRAGLRLSGNRTFTRLLFAVNGAPRHFERYPDGWDLNGSVHYASPSLGSLKLFGISQADRVGVEVDHEEFEGILEASSRQRAVTGRWERALADHWQAAASFGQDRYLRQLSVGVFDLDLGDRVRSWRLGVTGDEARWTLRFGADGDQRHTTITGQVPGQGGDYGGTRSLQKAFEVHYDDWRAGAYLEGERPLGRLTATLGARVDYFANADAVRMAPRINFLFNLSGKQRARLAWGLYNQAPAPEYYDAVRGTPSLPPSEALHYVAGYERGSETDPLYLRAEVYHKRYRRLPVEAPGGFAPQGYGSADGVDLFARGRWRSLEFRQSYSWMQARRRWTPIFESGRYPLPEGAWTPDFSIPHTFHTVASYKVTSALTMGVSWRMASGKPFTPVVGAAPTPYGLGPLYGPINSERLPPYRRLDASISRLAALGAHCRLLLFAGVGNLLRRQNTFEYRYSPDFSERRPVTSDAPRAFYFGVGIFG